jgi:hypothetical protein
VICISEKQNIFRNGLDKRGKPMHGAQGDLPVGQNEQ